MTSKKPGDGSRQVTPRSPDWLEPADAARRVVAGVGVLGSEEVDLASAVGKVLAGDVTATIDVPRWTNSAMDGFAVRARDVAGASRKAPVVLPVVDDIAAGSFPAGPLPPGAAARVMTGAPVPEGADSVIRVEHTDAGSNLGQAEARVRIYDPHDAGRNLRQRGEDIREGATALRAGTLLSPGAIGVAASLGHARLEVIRSPLVALLTSGNELVEVERFEEVAAGRRIISSNTYTLSAQLRAAGCEVRYLGIAEDSPESLREALGRAKGCDALVTSAGISVGEHDHVRTVLEELDTAIAFWRARIRPGSPFAFGTIGGLGGIPWFGLPGNPVSSMVTFELFARPALLRMAGHERCFPARLPARLVEPVHAQAGLTHFIRVRLELLPEGEWSATPTGPQGSGILRSLAEADGLMIIPPDADGVAAGETLQVIPLDPSRRLLTPLPAY